MVDLPMVSGCEGNPGGALWVVGVSPALGLLLQLVGWFWLLGLFVSQLNIHWHKVFGRRNRRQA